MLITYVVLMWGSTSSHLELFRLSQGVSSGDEIKEALANALDSREKQTTDLVKSVVAATPRLSPPEATDLQRACQRLQSEVSCPKYTSFGRVDNPIPCRKPV